MMKRFLLFLVLFVPATIKAQSTSVTCPAKTTPKVVTSGQVVTVTCSLTPPPPLSFTTPVTMPVAKVGSPYSANLAALAKPTGGVAPYAYSAIGLPAGLTISSAGLITGTPKVAGITKFSFTVIDSSSANIWIMEGVIDAQIVFNIPAFHSSTR